MAARRAGHGRGTPDPLTTVLPLPSRRLLGLLVLASPLLLWRPGIGLLVDLILVAAALVDAWRAPTIAVSRELPAHLSLGEPGTARLTLTAPGSRPVRLRITDDLPPDVVRLDPDVAEPTLSPDADVVYRFRPGERGPHRFGDAHLRVRAPLGLAWRQRRVTMQDEVVVLPGLDELRRLRALGIRERLRRAGLRNVRQRGEGRSFESLREYVAGDDPRTVDWKSSAHRGSLMVRQYEAERSQDVVLVLDAGRMMLERIEGRERLDHAMSAALQVGDVARLQGDRVGLFCFADDVLAWLPPLRTSPALFADTLARVRPRWVEPNYPLAFSVLRSRLGRRALIVVFTDVVDASASQALLGQLGRSAQRHVVLTVALRNPEMEAWARQSPDTDVAAYRRAAAEEMLEARTVALGHMRRAGVEGLDVAPTRAVAATVDRYLTIKYRGRL